MHDTGKKNAAIIGIGNLIMGDDGFGIHVIQYLEKHFRFPEDVNLVDGGTAGIYMAPLFEATDRAIVIDVIAMDLEPGSIVCLGHDEMKGRITSSSMSPHQIGVLEVLEICRFNGTAPRKVDFICVVPDKILPSTRLSPALSPITAKVALMVTDILKQEGFSIEDA